MAELKRCSDMVKEILKENEQARSDDNVLILEVIKTYGKQNVSIGEYLKMQKVWKIPSFETIRRTRQKVQECHPELRGSDIAETYRMLLEDDYKDFARRHDI